MFLHILPCTYTCNIPSLNDDVDDRADYRFRVAYKTKAITFLLLFDDRAIFILEQGQSRALIKQKVANGVGFQSTNAADRCGMRNLRIYDYSEKRLSLQGEIELAKVPSSRVSCDFQVV